MEPLYLTISTLALIFLSPKKERMILNAPNVPHIQRCSNFYYINQVQTIIELDYSYYLGQHVYRIIGYLNLMKNDLSFFKNSLIKNDIEHQYTSFVHSIHNSSLSG